MNKLKPHRPQRKFFFIFALSALFVVNNIYAQQNSPYTIPRQIFIGDYAILIIPLPASTENHPDITITTGLPAHDNIDFHKIILERRINTGRLIIEFTAFTTGEIELPLIEIGGYYFPDLIINVDSIIDRRNAITLSSPASSLAMPGTAFMLYGTMAAIIFLLLASFWFIVKGKKLIALWKEKWNRWRMFTNIRQTERRLYKACLKGMETRTILNKLSDEFRNFLSLLLNQNCRAMTARELGKIGSNIDLADYFTLLDSYRFSAPNPSGISASKENVIQLLKDLRIFIDAQEGKFK